MRLSLLLHPTLFTLVLSLGFDKGKAPWFHKYKQFIPNKGRPWATKDLHACTVPCFEEYFMVVAKCSLNDEDCVCEPENLSRMSEGSMCLTENCHIYDLRTSVRVLRDKCATYLGGKDQTYDGP